MVNWDGSESYGEYNSSQFYFIIVNKISYDIRSDLRPKINFSSQSYQLSTPGVDDQDLRDVVINEISQRRCGNCVYPDEREGDERERKERGRERERRERERRGRESESNRGIQ